MKWVRKLDSMNVPIKSWAEEIEDSAMEQALNLSRMPNVFKHIALMPDAHSGYGMPIGGVTALIGAVSPNMVGKDIGCGMAAIKTNILINELNDTVIKNIITTMENMIPHGEGEVYEYEQDWRGFDIYTHNLDGNYPKWINPNGWAWIKRSLGTLGGGNHFIEIQKGDDGHVWLMLHSGSRNLGSTVCDYYHELALSLNKKWHTALPVDQLAFLPTDTIEGGHYIRDMNFALKFAEENRLRMMDIFKTVFEAELANVVNTDVEYLVEINIHHNYAVMENHFGQPVWVHRKGATSAKKDQLGIIPGAQGSSSYIVKGLGNQDSFMSCSHGAGRAMSRIQANREITLEQANASMNGVVFSGWKKRKIRKGKHIVELDEYDFGEVRDSYKNIDQVMEAQNDLVEIITKLHTWGVIKG